MNVKIIHNLFYGKFVISFIFGLMLTLSPIDSLIKNLYGIERSYWLSRYLLTNTKFIVVVACFVLYFTIISHAITAIWKVKTAKNTFKDVLMISIIEIIILSNFILSYIGIVLNKTVLGVIVLVFSIYSAVLMYKYIRTKTSENEYNTLH